MPTIPISLEITAHNSGGGGSGSSKKSRKRASSSGGDESEREEPKRMRISTAKASGKGAKDPAPESIQAYKAQFNALVAKLPDDCFGEGGRPALIPA